LLQENRFIIDKKKNIIIIFSFIIKIFYFINKKRTSSVSHRSTTYPCYLPVLGEFSRSWSHKDLSLDCKDKYYFHKTNIYLIIFYLFFQLLLLLFLFQRFQALLILFYFLILLIPSLWSPRF